MVRHQRRGLEVDPNIVKRVSKARKKEELHTSLDVSHTEVNQEIEPDKNHEQQAETHSDHSFPTDRESSNFLIMDGTFELNVQEHRLQEYLQSNYSLPSDNESSDGHFSDLVEDPKQKLLSKLPDFVLDSIFKQQGLIELLA
ncbi:hypothetical protein GmHk_07G020296 [Glycine max]|nr:hypothetical protein GmHk_07G020296 [Glycine max]